MINKELSGYIFLIAIIFILSTFIGGFGGLGDNSDDEGVGNIVKVSEKGWFFKTQEVELVMSSTVQSYIFEVSICDKDKDKFKILENNLGNNVKVKYHSPFIYWTWNQKSKYCLLSVEVLK